jgi:chromosome segregation ATPase
MAKSHDETTILQAGPQTEIETLKKMNDSSNMEVAATKTAQRVSTAKLEDEIASINSHHQIDIEQLRDANGTSNTELSAARQARETTITNVASLNLQVTNLNTQLDKLQARNDDLGDQERKARKLYTVAKASTKSVEAQSKKEAQVAKETHDNTMAELGGQLEQTKRVNDVPRKNLEYAEAREKTLREKLVLKAQELSLAEVTTVITVAPLRQPVAVDQKQSTTKVSCSEPEQLELSDVITSSTKLPAVQRPNEGTDTHRTITGLQEGALVDVQTNERTSKNFEADSDSRTVNQSI